MSISTSYDLVSDAIADEQYGLQGQILSKTITRIVRVRGLVPIGSGLSLTSDIPTQAVQYMQGQIPILTASPLDAQCLSRGYRFTADPGQTDGGLVTISYVWQFPSFTVESNGGLQGITTDSEFHTTGSSTRTPILVPWVNNAFMGVPGNTVSSTVPGGNSITVPTNGIYYVNDAGNVSTSGPNATLYVNADVPVQVPTFGQSISIVVSESTYNSVLAVKGTYLGKVNSETFVAGGGDSTVDAPYMWLCDAINCSADVFTAYYQIQLHFTWRFGGWFEWVRGDVTPPDANNFWRYDQTGMENPNGFYKSRPYLDADLDTLVALAT